MQEIRPFQDEHVEDVANLYLRAGLNQRRPAPQGLKDAFRESFLCNPWVASDITPLVYIDGGKLVGFLGVIPRPMEFRGRPIRVATVTVWLVDHEQHRGFAGVKLLRHVLNGPQDFMLTDGSANEASTVYEAVGGRISPVYSFNWFRLLRPFQTARSHFDRFGGIFRTLQGAAGLLTAPLDFLLSKAPVAVLRTPKSPLSRKVVSAAELLECIQEARGRESIQPAYAMPSFGWLLSQAAKGPDHECLRAGIAHAADGNRCGWFVYYARRGRPAYVLGIGSHRKSQFAEVLQALFEDAWEQGCSAVKGQAIPQHLTTLTEQHCLFRQPYSCVIGHSRDPEIMQAFQAADMALCRLDSGSWLRIPAEASA